MNAECPEIFYSSLSALVEHVKGLPGEASLRDEWSGGDLNDGIRLATYGWPEGAAMAADRAVSIAGRICESTTAQALITEIQADVTGAALDVGAYLAGEPECWINFVPQECARGVHIVANLSTSAGVSPDTITKRGIATAALAIALQSAGYAITIDVIGTYKVAKQSTIHSVRVADGESGSVLDLDRIVFALAHPSMPRRLMFAVCCKSKQTDKMIFWAERGGITSSQDAFRPLELGTIDLWLGPAHLDQVERWQDGGEAWILSEYERQTRA